MKRKIYGSLTHGFNLKTKRANKFQVSDNYQLLKQKKIEGKELAFLPKYLCFYILNWGLPQRLHIEKLPKPMRRRILSSSLRRKKKGCFCTQVIVSKAVSSTERNLGVWNHKANTSSACWHQRCLGVRYLIRVNIQYPNLDLTKLR